MRTIRIMLCCCLAAACGKDEKPAPAGPPPKAPEQPAANQPASPPAAPHATPGAAAAGGTASQGDDGRYTIGSLAVAVPDDWQSEPVTSGMRKAQFALPAAEGDTAPTELVVYHFGNRGAGSVQANIDRWVGQFQQPDGAEPTIDKREVGGMAVTTVDVSGHYVAAMRPGAPQKHDKPDHRMLAAIVEAPDGAYYFKLVGPAASVAAQADAFTKAIDSIGQR